MDFKTDNTLCEHLTWEDFITRVNYENLSVLCLNSWSLTNKFARLQSNLALIKKRITFIFIIESWLKPCTDFALELPGYRSKSLYRVEKKEVALSFITRRIYLFMLLNL